MTGYPRFHCPECGRLVASVYREVHVSVPDGRGRRHQYAYLRRHKGVGGGTCPADTTGSLATIR